MTVSSIKVKVVRRPTLKLKVLPKFPANVVAANFVTLTRNGGTYTIGADFTVLTPGPIADPTTAYVAILDQTSGVYRTVTLASLLTSGLDADLQAIAALTGTGILARTASNTWVLRTIAGTANEITITNGDGVAGNPTASLPAALTFTGKTVTGGTFSAPTITGGTHTAITSLGVRSTGAAFDLTFANTEVLTAGRALTVTLNDAARTLNMGGNLTLAGALTTSGAFASTFTMTGTTTVTFPTTGTLVSSATTAGGDLTGTYPSPTIAANAVSNTKFRQSVALSVVGVTGNATANVADIAGTANQVLRVNGAGTALAFGAIDLSQAAAATGVLQAASHPALTGDVTNTVGTLATTIAANAVTNAKMATMAAFTLKGNNTSGVATPTDVDISLLTAKASPVATDLVMISDQAASGAWKKVTISSLASAGSVASIAGNTGAFTLAYPLGNVVNDIRYVGPTDSGQLTWTSTTALAFKPYKGDTIKINGIVYQIPSAGIAGLGAPTSVFLDGAAAQTLAINTTYYIYAFNNAGTITADFSTVGHISSAAAGNVGTEVKSNAVDRSLIGMVRTGATVVYADDIRTASWFNRRRKSVIIAQSLAAAGNTTAIDFVNWAEEAFTIASVGYMQNTALNNVSFVNRLDAGGVGQTIAGTIGGANFTLPTNVTRTMTSTEGKHTFDATLAAGGGTVAFTGESYVEIRG